MKKNSFIISLTVLLLLVSVATQAQVRRVQSTPCLDYKTVGMSGCSGNPLPVALEEEPEPEDIPQLPPQQVFMEPQQQATVTINAPRQKTLDERIDEFLENHGKPPREFVAFNLEPTLENAMKWVVKFNSMLERQKDITVAWMQARKIIEEAERTGQSDIIPVLDDGMMDVPDFGVSIGEDSERVLAALPDSTADLMRNTFNMDGMGQMPNVGGGPTSPNANQPFRNVDMRAVSTGSAPLNSLRNSVGGGEGPIRVSYYFSADCAYCQKFEPEFQQVINDMEGRLDVTCVDMTPSGQRQANINGKVDCSWRPLMQGEMDAYGIKSTPSLIISRNDGGPLERVSGYVEAAQLRKHLLEGVQQ